MTGRKMQVTYSERWQRRQAERERRDARLDYGALLPCAWCDQRHEPRRCRDARERQA